jgi:hypothetical protein
VAERLLEQLSAGGYLLADGNSDWGPLTDRADARGYQLLAPLPAPAGKGHRYQSPHRLRTRDLLAGEFGKALYALRSSRERSFGNATSFAAGLGETTASGSYLGVGQTLDQRCPNCEKSRTYVLNAKGSLATGRSTRR